MLPADYQPKNFITVASIFTFIVLIASFITEIVSFTG